MKYLAKNFVLFFLIVIIFSVLSVVAQPVLTDRQRDFGKSLKTYEKKQAPSQSPAENQNNEDVIRVNTDLIVTDVLVVNQKGNAILGLKKEDFIVTEDGVEQEVSQFSPGEKAEIPRSLVLIFDYSTSLLPYIKTSIESAKLLVDKLGPKDRIALVTDDVELLVDFTTDKSAIKSALDKLLKKTLSVKQGGKSNPYSALLASINELFSDEDIQPIVIFQTDGDEFTRLKPRWKEWEKYDGKIKRYDISERPFSFADIKFAAEKSRVTIYSVVPGIRFAGMPSDEQIKRGRELVKMDSGRMNYFPSERQLQELTSVYLRQFLAFQMSLVDISNISGGYADFLEKPEDAEMIYSTILQVMNNRYIIGYYPKNEAKDGKRRRIKIEVKGHPEYVVVGRKSYIAESK